MSTTSRQDRLTQLPEGLPMLRLPARSLGRVRSPLRPAPRPAERSGAARRALSGRRVTIAMVGAMILLRGWAAAAPTQAGSAHFDREADARPTTTGRGHGSGLQAIVVAPDYVGQGLDSRIVVPLVNYGPVTALRVRLYVALPDGLRVVSASSLTETRLPSRHLRLIETSLAPGQTRTYTLLVRATQLTRTSDIRTIVFSRTRSVPVVSNERRTVSRPTR